ncbi:MAG: hypothetical protein ABEI75_00850 [Halobaculum sp.]
MARERGFDRLNRRTVLKTAAAGTALASGVAVVAADGPDGQAVSPSETTLPNPDMQVTKVGRSVKSAVPHWPMLTLPASTITRYIRQSGLSGTRKREAIDALRTLRGRFPVRRERDGNVTRLVLATDRAANETDTALARTAHRAFAEGAGGGAATTQSTKAIHEDQAREACDEMGIGGSAKTDIVEGSDDPDNWDVDIGVPDSIPHQQTVENGLETGLNNLLRYYGQYYDPGVFEIYHSDNHDVDFGTLGGAPAAADIEYDYAEYYSSDLYLGRTTHYFSDVGVPLHTSMGWEQVNLEIYTNSDGNIDFRIDPLYWLHGESEQYLEDNWESGENLVYQFNSNNCSGDYCYYPINSISQGIKDLSDISEDYAYDIYQKILDEGDIGWQNWTADTKDYHKKAFENTIHEVGLYTRGVLELMH